LREEGAHPPACPQAPPRPPAGHVAGVPDDAPGEPLRRAAGGRRRLSRYCGRTTPRARGDATVHLGQHGPERARTPVSGVGYPPGGAKF
jgi:hypothetical protein